MQTEDNIKLLGLIKISGSFSVSQGLQADH